MSRPAVKDYDTSFDWFTSEKLWANMLVSEWGRKHWITVLIKKGFPLITVIGKKVQLEGERETTIFILSRHVGWKSGE